MKAYVLEKTGGPEVLSIGEFPEPSPGPGEVKVKIAAIGLNYAEVLSRRGQYTWAPKRPYIPGMEAYGEVVEVGEGVEKVAVGQMVLAGNQYGSYAEYACVPEHLIFPALESLTAAENAALLVCYMTAWVALKKQARVQATDRVLVQAAAGGVGTAAVQLASALGCQVFGTASKQDKLDVVASMGATETVNYAKEDFCEVLRKKYGGVDVVLEVVGGEVFRKSMELLDPFGRLVVIGYASISFNKWKPWTWWQTWKDAPKVNMMEMAKRSVGVSASHIGYLTALPELSKELWAELATFITTHEIKPYVGRTFKFDEMDQAHRFMESRDSIGKIVIEVNNSK